MTAPADLRGIDTWLFDLDHTLYPPDCPLMDMVDERMNAYVARGSPVWSRRPPARCATTISSSTARP